MADRPALPANPQTPAPRSSTGGHGLGLYKSGQGYWTRVGTAIGLGLLLISAIAWAVRQCELITIPAASWTLTLASNDAAFTVGSPVTLTSETPATDPAAPATVNQIGTAKVLDSTKGSTGRLRVTVNEFVPPTGEIHTVREAKIVTAGAVTSKIDSVEVNAKFNPLWLQGGTALTILLIGGGLIYYVVGMRPRTVDFLIATDGEMKKVNWSTRKTIIDSTKMVVLACVLIAASIYIIDLVFRQFFVLIGVIDG